MFRFSTRWAKISSYFWYCIHVFLFKIGVSLHKENKDCQRTKVFRLNMKQKTGTTIYSKKTQGQLPWGNKLDRVHLKKKNSFSRNWLWCLWFKRWWSKRNLDGSTRRVSSRNTLIIKSYLDTVTQIEKCWMWRGKGYQSSHKREFPVIIETKNGVREVSCVSSFRISTNSVV